MIHRLENGLIVSDQGTEQWLGTAAEFLADFGAPFDVTTPPTLDQNRMGLNNHYYRVDGTGSISSWTELRA